MPRVLFIDGSPFEGGAQKSLWQLIERTEGCALAVAGGLAPLARQAGRPFLELDSRHWQASPRGLLEFASDRLRLQGPLKDFIAENNPEIVHANTVRSAMLILGMGLKMPVFVHDRDIRMPRAIPRLVAGMGDVHVVAISSAVLSKWSGLLPPGKCHVVCNGIDPAAIAKVKPVDMELPGAKIILAADMAPWKRHGLFIEAARLARQVRPGLTAVVKGRACTSAGCRLKTKLKAMVSGDAGFLFPDAPDSALPWIAASDVLVSCSDAEPFGRTVLEALAMGSKVAATPGATSRELLDEWWDFIHVARRDSPDALAEAILDALEDTRRNPPVPASLTAEHMVLAIGKAWRTALD